MYCTVQYALQPQFRLHIPFLGIARPQPHTAKTNHRNFETNIPRKGILGPQPQFPQLCVCDRFIYSHDRSPYSAGGNMYVDRSWDYINRSQIHECWNWGWGRAIPRKGIYKGDFRCSAISTFMCLWAIYIFPESVQIFPPSRKGRRIVEIYNSLTDTWMWKLGLRPRYSFSGNICFKFSAFCLCSVCAISNLRSTMIHL